MFRQEILKTISDEMLNKQRITSLQQLNELNEVDEANNEPCLHVVYESGEEQWVRGESNVNAFVNSLLSAR